MKKIFLISFVLLSMYPLMAQEKDSTYKYWITIGFWQGSDGSVNLNYNFSLSDYFYKIDFLRKGDTIFGGLGSDGYSFNSINVSIGKRVQYKWFQTSYYAGPSFIFGEKEYLTNYIEKFNTIGFETDLQLLFRLANEVGIGIEIYNNINFTKNFNGININITLGNGK